MSDDKIIDLSKERAAREDAALDLFQSEAVDFERGTYDQIERLRDICDGDSLPFRHGDQVLRVPFHLFVDALAQKLLAGMSALRIEEDPEAGQVARVIPLKRSVKPKRPKAPKTTLRAELVLTPEEQEERRVQREARKAERRRQREARLAYLEARYGDAPAQAYASLMGWR